MSHSPRERVLPALSALPRSRRAYVLVRAALGVLFIVAGAMKLGNPEEFAVTVRAFGILPDAAVTPLSVALPALEVAAGVGLLLDLAGSLATIAFLLLVFLAVLAHAMRLGLDIDCGCYGPRDPEARAFGSIRTSFVRDCAMLAGVTFLYWWRRALRHAPARPADLLKPLFPKETRLP